MNLIDTKAIALVKIAELGSFTKAAEALCITQPAISQQIKQLEDECGTRLVERNKGKVSLTQSGKIVVKYVRRMISLSNTINQAMLDEKTNVTSISVGITHSVESSAIIEAVASYAGSHNIAVKVTSDTNENLHRMLKNFELDFLIIDGRLDDPKFNQTLLTTDCISLITAPDHRLANRSSVSLEELKKESLILRLQDSNTRHLFEDSIKQQHFSIADFNVILEIDNIATIKDLIRRNLGVSVLAKSACLDEYKKGKIAVLNIDDVSMVREINFVFPKDFEHPEVIRGVSQIFNGM